MCGPAQSAALWQFRIRKALLFGSAVSFYFLFQLFICTTLEEDLKETALYLALIDGGEDRKM